MARNVVYGRRMRLNACFVLVLAAGCHSNGLGFGNDTGDDVIVGPDLGDDFKDDLPPDSPPLDPKSFSTPSEGCGVAGAPILDPCGDSSACLVHDDEALPAGPGWNDGPQIVMDSPGPLVFVPMGTAQSTGQLLRRDASGWHKSPTQTGITGALASSFGGVARLDYDGAFGLTYYDEDASGWSAHPFTEEYVSFGHSLALDDAGCAYVAVTLSDRDRLRVGRRIDDWSWAAPFGYDEVERPLLALGLDGAPQVVGWHGDASGWTLSWTRIPGTPEAVQPSIGNALSAPEMRFATLGDAPHLLWQAGGLAHSFRDAGGAWHTETIAPADDGAGACGGIPPGDGLGCDATTTHAAPVAVLADGGSALRLVWTRSQTIAHYTSSCPGGPPSGPHPDPDPDLSPDLGQPWAPPCSWDLTSSTTKSALYVSPPELAASATPIALDHGLLRASAVLAADGTIHVVGEDDAVIRYLTVAK